MTNHEDIFDWLIDRGFDRPEIDLIKQGIDICGYRLPESEKEECEQHVMSCEGGNFIPNYSYCLKCGYAPNKPTPAAEECICEYGVAGCPIHNSKFWKGTESNAQLSQVSKISGPCFFCYEKAITYQDGNKVCVNHVKFGSQEQVSESDKVSGKEELDEYKLRRFLYRYCPRSVPLDTQEIDSLAKDICNLFKLVDVSVEEIIQIADKHLDRSPKGQDIYAKDYMPIKKFAFRQIFIDIHALLVGRGK